MKITQLQDTKLINNMTPPRANPSVIMLDHGDSLDDYLFERGDLLDALSTKIYYDDVKTELATIYDVVTTKLRNHISDTCCHITAEERRRWNSCLSKEYVTGLIDAINQRLDGHEVILDQLQQEIADLPDFTQFVLRSELPDWSQFVTKEYLDEVLRNNVTTDNFMDELLAALGDIDPGDIDLHGYVKEGGYLGKINGIDFYQGHSIEIPTGGGGGDTGLPYKVTGLTYANNRLVLTQENNPNSPFEVEIDGGGGGGSSYVLPVATSTTLGGIKIGHPGGPDNFPVALDGGKAYVHVPISSIDPSGGGGETAGYYETIYTSVNGDSVPDTPANNITPANSYTSVSGTYIWEHSAANSDGTNKVWMATRWNTNSTTGGAWSSAWLITGPEGDAGADGTIFEYVYTITTQEGNWRTIGIADPNYDYSTNPGSIYQQDDFVPIGWTDNPQGVDEINRFEWVSIREKINGEWSEFSTPVIWSAYGRNGTDGDGVEYIYYLDSGSTNPPRPNSAPNGRDWPPSWVYDSGYQSTEYIRSESLWTDDPYQNVQPGDTRWVSVRKKQDGVWQAYSTPSIWSYYARDGQDGTVQYLEYPSLRYRDVWNRNEPSRTGILDGASVTFIYNDGTISEDGVYYQDIVEFTNPNTNVTSFFKCILHNNAPNRPDDGVHWEEFIANGNAAFDAIIANSAYIQSLSVEQLVVFDNSNQICAGMSGNSATVGLSDIRIWAGAIASSGSVVPGNLANAPFTVDKNGRLKATDAILSGQLTVGSTSGKHVFIGKENGDNIVAIRNGQYIITQIGGDYEQDQGVVNFINNDGSGHLGNLTWNSNGELTSVQTAPDCVFSFGQGADIVINNTSCINFGTTGYEGRMKINNVTYKVSEDNGYLKLTAV